jgi:small conductance mechanosensitive channel
MLRDKRVTQFIAAMGLSFLLGVGLASSSRAEDAAAPAADAAPKAATKEAEPVTTKDPQIALDDLELLLEPMTAEEIGTEAKGWFALLQAKEREISVAELDVRRKNREIAQLEKQKSAAADLAKATEEVKAATTDKDKEAAAQHLADAQKNLAQAVATASKESVKEEKKAEATTAAMAKQADAAPPPAAATDAGTAAAAVKVVPAADDKDVLQKAAETAAKKSEGTGDTAKVEKVVAASEKEAATADQIKSLAASAPAAAGNAAAAAATAPPGAAPAAVGDASKKAEKLAEKTDEAAAAKTDVKVQLVDYSTQLMSEHTALVDRLKVVLDKWEAKGGDPKAYRLYIASIGGIKIDVSDRAATMARITAWLTADEGGLRLARDLATFLGYIIGSIIVAWIVRMILRRVMSGGRVTSHLLRDFIISSSGRIIVLIGVLLGLSALEVNLAPLLAVIGAAGFVVAFALQGTLSNFASGLLIMVNKPFDVGDEVEVGGGIKGRVTRVSIFSTYIETDDGFMKIVPNDNIWKAVIVNQTTGVVKDPPVAEAKPADAKPAAG